jgi:aldehyde dehydrogenase (NAD+)
MAIPCWKMTAALITGNVVVLKPASDTPHCAALLIELMHEAGFPAGVVNMVTGSGEDVGTPLVENPDVNVISFTGNGDTGRDIAVRAGRRLTRLSLELGGKNAIAVMADADLDLAVEGILWSAFGTTGQRCTACSRLVVDDAVADDLVGRLVDRARGMRLGSGLESATDVGPLINSRAVERVGRYVEIGTEEGARLVVGGSAATDGDLANGSFFTPTILDGVRYMDRVAQEEIFGPVLSVIKFKSDDDAVRIANDTIYGLAASVWSEDHERAVTAAKGIRAGTVWINDHHLINCIAPFGGYKQSGLGRELGPDAPMAFTEEKNVFIAH